ncbi:hypothetical protein [Algibacter mikhailovii]|uniref:hypothetical protein n=1 Tax=Algibacter mikhailovii TaxID=425498 RepID=UPI002493D205|nr:hypothetical protein [Algibacter mikhailovii]
MSKQVQNIFVVVVFLISLSSIKQWTDLPVKNTTIWWLIYAFIIFLLFKAKKKYYGHENNSNFYFIKIYLIWNSVCILRGFFVAEDYWEWKQLIGTGMVLLLPFVAFISTNTYYVQKIASNWITYVLPSFVLIALFTEHGAYGRYLIPISFVLLFFPLLNGKWKLFSVLITLYVISIDLGARSNVIKFVVPLLIGLIYYFRGYIILNILNYVRLFLLISPILFLILGITNVFNIFKMSDYIEGDYKVESSNKEWEGDGDLTVDTRTFIYEEVILSALKHNYVWMGRTPARGNESPSFGPQIDKELNRNKNERFTNEVGIANVFTWTGLIGVILYFLIFIKSSYLAIRKSNNWFIKLTGVYICFRWFYAWVEDFSSFDLSTIFLWICIAMCISKEFRAMSDEEFKSWFRGIFDRRYRDAILKKQLVVLNK